MPEGKTKMQQVVQDVLISKLDSSVWSKDEHSSQTKLHPQRWRYSMLMCVWWGDMRNGRGYCWLISGVGRASKYIMEWNGETMLNIESFYDSSCTEGIYFDYIPRILERAGRICGYWCKQPWSLSLKQLPKHLHSAPPEWSNGSQSFLSSLCSRITSPVQFNCLFVSFCF